MTNLLRDMQRQWEHDGNGTIARNALRKWAQCDPGLARFDSPAHLVRACHRRSDSAACDSLERLTAVAPADPWAARTVLQAVLPGLASLARAHYDMVGLAPEPFATVDELDQFLVCTAFECITQLGSEVGRYRLRTILDTTWTRLRAHAGAHRREQRRREVLDGGECGNAAPARTEAEELAALLVDAVERRVLRPIDAGIVYTTRVAGHSPTEVAEVLQWKLKTLYRRRDRTEAVVAAEALGRPRPACQVRPMPAHA
jgi:hypothetical protein